MPHILMATSEAVPFAKTGGLADVCGALPLELSRLGHPTTLIIPAYEQVLQSGQPIEDTDIYFDIPIANRIVQGRLLSSRLPDSDVTVYLVRHDDYFARPQLYGENGKDYADNCERFVFFSRAVLEAIRLLDLSVDVLHVNDWQTGLIPAYLNINYAHARGYEDIVSIMTIHNMSYQGRFWHWDMALTGLDWKYFNWHQMEFYGELNLLKTGLVFADAITTVSPRYAQEIQQSPLGCGLEGVLQQRRNVLRGIINGVDYSVWNPRTDEFIAQPYDATEWQPGKAACKAALQQAVGLPTRPGVPLIGIISRLVDQKGLDLIVPLMKKRLSQSDTQWVILGTGDPRYHEALAQIAREFPQQVAVKLEFNTPLSHMVEAGADMFLMPSLFEPCGLNQLYSLKYGTVPIVHAVGGLADTIVNASEEGMHSGIANGFAFTEYSPEALEAAFDRAWQIYTHQPTVWQRLVQTGMEQDWSWRSSAAKYVALYEDTIARVRPTVCA